MPILGRILGSESGAQPRLAALRALERIGGRRARLRLELTLADPDPLIRDAAESALAVWPE